MTIHASIKLLDNNEDPILRLARIFGFKIPKDLIFGEMEYIDLVKGEETVYRYEGPKPERDFCKEMIRLDKFYTKAEINIMSFQGKNKSFGHKGQNYSIFKYCGGPFCKHNWVVYTIIRDKNNKITQTVKVNNAPGLAGEPAKASNRFKTHPNGPFKNL
jgi:hypothetical protein